MFVQDPIADDILQHCDRTRSSEAREALQNLLYKPLDSLSLTLSTDCPLHASNDILRLQESHKVALTDGLWSCTICQKIFRSEYFVDKHLARKHANVRHGSGVTCLADLCGVLMPCVPRTVRVVPRVSTVEVRQEDAGNEEFGERGVGVGKVEFCEDEGVKRRRVEACVETYRGCLQGGGVWREGVLQRIRRDLCERAVVVECAPREKVWEMLGGAKVLLKPSVNRRISWWSLVGMLMGIFVLGMWKVVGKGRRTRSGERRRRARRKGDKSI